MTTKTRLLPALLLSIAAAAAPAANAQQFSNVIIFGDSLSDAGTFRPFLTAIGYPASLVATMGRFTTNPGPVWSERVAQYYGVANPGPSNAGGTIYAQGGARVALSPGITPPGMPERPISTQITEYLTANGGAADRGALFTMWGGANDIFVNLAALQAGQITQTQLQTNVLGAATAEIQQIGRLMGAGARYVVVFALPDIGATPNFRGTPFQSAVTQLSAGYNTTLFSGLAGAGLRVIPIDVFSLGAEIAANPAAYGFSNSTGIACTSTAPGSTSVSSLFCNPGTLVNAGAPESYVYADSVHPTTATHRIFAQFAESMIDAPAMYSLLAEAPLHTRESHQRSISDWLAVSKQGQIGRWTIFAAGDRGKFDVDPSMGVAGMGTTNKSGTLGTYVRVAENVSLGLAVGRSETDATFGDSRGSFSTKESILSFFGSVYYGGFYGLAIGSISDLKLDNVQRNIVLGAVTRTATSSPKASNASFYASAGYDWRFGQVGVGPLVSLNSQNVDVDAFDEANAGSANLHIGTQHRRSEVWSVGLRATYDIGAWTPWVRVTRDRENRGNDRVVTAMPLSLASTGNSYDIPAFNPAGSWTTGAIGIAGTFMERIGASLAYTKVFSRSGISQDGVSGMLSYRF
jgi:outer membrane lipase/esterase